MPHRVNLRHRESGRIVTALITHNVVEPEAGFGRAFPWSEHRAAVEDALLGTDETVFEPWPQKIETDMTGQLVRSST